MNVREDKYYRQGLLEGLEFKDIGAGGVQLRVSTLAEILHCPQEQAVKKVLADYGHRLDSLPCLAQFPELTGMRECVLAYERGLAESSGLTAEAIVVMRTYLYTVTQSMRSSDPALKPAAATNEPGCTLILFPKSDRGPLLANNTDDVLRPNLGSQQVPPVWPVANRAGLIVGTVSSGLYDDEVSPEIFPVPVFLLLYELCSTAKEAAQLLIKLNLFWGPCNCLVADGQGGAAVVEKSTCRFGLRESQDGFIATTAMAAEEPVFKNYLWESRERSLSQRGLDRTSVDWTYWKAAESRSQRLQDMVQSAKANPTYAEIEAIAYDHTGEPDQLHMDGNLCHPEETDPNWTLRTVIHVINEKASTYSFAEPPLGGHLTDRHQKNFPNESPIF